MASTQFPAPTTDRRDLFDRPPPPQRPPPSKPGRSVAINVVLFLLTIASVMFVSITPEEGQTIWTAKTLLSGWKFALPLMIILVAHELGHYVAAKIHRVPASLPYFIPLPVSIIGTMGAVISMRGRIRSRDALLDIGASGPIAGMVFALPILVWGLLHSEVQQVTGQGFVEGQCLLYWLLKRLTVGPIPEGSDVFLHPAAFAGWVGLLITMINLMPIGQLDGGHIAYALFGPKQDKAARFFHFGLLAVFVVNFTYNFVVRMGALDVVDNALKALELSMFWPIWFVVLGVMRRMAGGNHPPTEPGELSTGRKIIAIITLLLFVLLFMPTPLARY